jgi:carbonic anhydrase
MNKRTCGNSLSTGVCRRSWLGAAWGSLGFAANGFAMQESALTREWALTKEQRDRLTPDDIVKQMKLGNARFRMGKPSPHNYVSQKRATSEGQYPSAVILGCIDSRAPAEIVLDAGIGTMFNARIAGNVVNDDVLGSMEFACAVAGAKVVLVLGHTACGAIKGAIDHVEMGNLTGLLARVQPAIKATVFADKKSSKNEAYVDAVARTNVLQAADVIRQRSAILADLEKKGSLKIVGAMYDISTGVVTFVS